MTASLCLLFPIPSFIRNHSTAHRATFCVFDINCEGVLSVAAGPTEIVKELYDKMLMSAGARTMSPNIWLWSAIEKCENREDIKLLFDIMQKLREFRLSNLCIHEIFSCHLCQEVARACARVGALDFELSSPQSGKMWCGCKEGKRELNDSGGARCTVYGHSGNGKGERNRLGGSIAAEPRTSTCLELETPMTISNRKASPPNKDSPSAAATWSQNFPNTSQTLFQRRRVFPLYPICPKAPAAPLLENSSATITRSITMIANPSPLFPFLFPAESSKEMAA